MPQCDLLILGAGAAGLTAAIFAGEAARASGLRIVVLEGARKPGAKILVSGGGRCNVTNRAVTPDDYFGGARPLVRSVLRAFDEARTLDWMRTLGVELKLEPTGKWFPVSDSARTVLDALLSATASAGVEVVCGARASAIERTADGTFRVSMAGDAEAWTSSRLILATGGLSLPKSGSDGWGLDQVRRLGHQVVPTTPALSPLVLEPEPGLAGRLREFSGVAIDGRLTLWDARRRRLHDVTGSLLLTHFGLSGPAALDMSRHFLRHRLENPAAPGCLTLGLARFESAERAEAWMRAEAQAHPRRTTLATIEQLLPARLAEAWCADAAATPLGQLGRASRLELAVRLAALPVRVSGDRGYSFAETTAGGVDLREIDVRTMASRKVPGLHLCGEMIDVDGRLGGFNFQWAWATGYLAGTGAVASLRERAGQAAEGSAGGA